MRNKPLQLHRQGWGRDVRHVVAHACSFQHPTTKQWHTLCGKRLDVPIAVKKVKGETDYWIYCRDCIQTARQNGQKWVLKHYDS